MTNKIAIVEETEEEAEDGGMIIREAEDYFDKVYAVESKDLKFFFDDDEDVNDHLMYAYCLQGNVEYKMFLLTSISKTVPTNPCYSQIWIWLIFWLQNVRYISN